MTLDTNIIIAYLEGEDEVVRALSDLKRSGTPFDFRNIAGLSIISL